MARMAPTIPTPFNTCAALSLKSGSSRFYWNTDSTNETARKLYDSYTTESGKVQYRIALPGSPT